MNNKKNSSQMVNELMRDEAFECLSAEAEKEIYYKIMAIVEAAKLEVVEDAEKFIGNLRVFSLR